MTPDNFTTHSKQLKRGATRALTGQASLTNSEGISTTTSKKAFARILLVVLIVIFVYVGSIVHNTFGFKNFFAIASSFISAPTNKVASSNGRTNILIMGRSGEGQDAPDLTDTMILVSVSLTQPKVVAISIPRDLWIPEIRAKINSAYFWGKNGSPYLDVSEMGGGISFSKIIAGEVVGQTIQYGVIIDFSAFKDVVDALGGIRVDVSQSFTDNLYPIAGRENDTCGGDATFACRYQTVSFNSGIQTMNGDTALIFVRSRHAEGDEGTDTAREARQQKVMEAVKKKITNPLVFLSPKVGLAMVNVLKTYVDTDMDSTSIAIIARKVANGSKSINQFLIPHELLVNPPISKAYDNQYVFIPKAGNGKWGEIQGWIKEKLK